MAPLIIEGNTLGEKHKNYNKLVNKVIDNNITQELSAIDFEKSDLDNLFKIDIASHNRNVEYILEVLKCEDELYMSRVIKQATWLITDEQYAHIINPVYLHSHLLPQMTVKGSNKFLLHIRLNLKNERRTEEFFRYYEEKRQIDLAVKWLPYCSLTCIEQAVAKYVDYINSSLFKKLCERSITVFDVFFGEVDIYVQHKFYKWIKFLLNSNTIKYLDLIERDGLEIMPTFNAKHTKILMKNCPQRIIDNFTKYCKYISIKTFAKYIPKMEIQNFLIKCVERRDTRSWLSNTKYLSCFFKHMPIDNKFHYLKQVFIEKAYINNKSYELEERNRMRILHRLVENAFYERNLLNTYNLVYQFAPFEDAFVDLKKVIQNESCPQQRMLMLSTIITCAGRNLNYIQILVQYFYDKHINEAFPVKQKFINKLSSFIDIQKIDERTWSNLNAIFHSMEVYTDSSNRHQKCIEIIIIYKVLRYEKVSEEIENKFEFHTFKNYLPRFTEKGKNRLFSYLYDLAQTKLENQVIKTQEDFCKAVDIMKKILNVLIDYKKSLIDFPYVLNKIEELIKINKKKSWNINMSFLYHVKASYKRHLFQIYFVLDPCEQILLNALKHDPHLLDCHREVIEDLRHHNGISIRKFLCKLRIYWSNSLACEWIGAYRNQLNQMDGHKAAVEGLCILQPLHQMLDIIQKHVPVKTKIHEGNSEEIVFNVRKQIAKTMHIIRPQPTPNEILSYTKGNYLQYALPSLNSILYNLSSIKSQNYVSQLLSSPVSLQKHGVSFAFAKLNTTDLLRIFSDILKSNQNATLKTVVFKHAFDRLCCEYNPTDIDSIWNFLDKFIDDLSLDENRRIYSILGEVDKVPQMIRAKYCIKSYNYLVKLPPRAHCKSIVNRLAFYTKNLIREIDGDFVARILLDFIENKYTDEDDSNTFNAIPVISAYLLCAENEEIQMKRYEQIFLPMWNISYPLWYRKEGNRYRKSIRNLLWDFTELLKNYLNDQRIIMPVKLFDRILTLLKEYLCSIRYYKMLRIWELTASLVKIFDKYYSPNDEYKTNDVLGEIFPKCVNNIGQLCIDCLKEDIESYGFHIWSVYSGSLSIALNYIGIPKTVQYDIYKEMLTGKEFIAAYLVVIDMLPISLDEENKQTIIETHKCIIANPSNVVKLHYYKTFNLDENFEYF